ncbi:hypothetical protein AU14_00390 [Marinobacter similis]|uniref:7TM-DISM receptor extracellular domain-containing protein n=1 Tax=Marinobacter similis TaxID=1420916 RepID=W5YTX8_9GAMM|nr:hypothetical protein AU14_00390 [Marinobacter similis]
MPLTFESPSELIVESNHLTLTHGLFYGALLVFSAFNLLLFFSSGTIYYFYNAFYMAAMGLFMFAMGGFANQYFWPNSASLANTSIPMSLVLCALSMTLFGRSFLEIGEKSLADLTTKALAWACFGFLGLTLLLPYRTGIMLNTVLALTVLGSLFIIAIGRWLEGYQPPSGTWSPGLSCSSEGSSMPWQHLAILPTSWPAKRLCRSWWVVRWCS